MSAEVTAALIEGGATVAGTGLNALSQAKLTKKQFRRSKQLMQYQNDINLANWNLQNAYNSPKEQVSRLKAAGLNPNLLYGSGTAATGNAGDVGSPSAVMGDLGSTDYSAAAQGIVQGLSLYQNWQLNKANLAHINADRERLNALTNSEMYRQALTAAETTGKSLDNAIKSAAKNDLISSYKAENDLKVARSKQLNYQSELMNLTMETAVAQAKLNLSKTRGEVELQKFNKRLIDANIAQMRANTSLAGQQFDWINNYGYSPGSASSAAGVIGGLATQLGSAAGRGIQNAWNKAFSKFKRSK